MPASKMIVACAVHFDKQLMDHIRCHRNDQAESMLNKNLAKESCERCGLTLLHHAARWGNEEITQILIKFGSEVDCLDKYGRTPLMRAIHYGQDLPVKILLRAGANIDIADVNGQSALQMALNPKYFDPEIIKVFFNRIRSEASTTEKRIERLFIAGCTLHCAVLTKDIEIVKGLQQRSAFDVNSRDNRHRTPLHIAALEDDFEMVKLLINYDADINALDISSSSPLYYAASSMNLDMLQFLLEHGADPNPEVSHFDQLPLFAVFIAGNKEDDERIRECVHLLLQHGAYTDNLLMFVSEIFDCYDKILESSRGLHCLTAHLAMLEMNGTLSRESIMLREEDFQHPLSSETFLKLEEYYDACQQTLKIIVLKKLTLFDLLNANQFEMRIHVRNKSFVSKVKEFCSKSQRQKLYPYYCKSLLKRISKAVRAIELEDKAILLINYLFKCNDNRLHIFGRKLVGYLSDRDLENLYHVWKFGPSKLVKVKK